MKKLITVVVASTILLSGCWTESEEKRTSRAVAHQQSQYSIGQPIPVYNWSLERDLLIQLYNVRNNRVATHAVWRSNYGKIEGDCSSMGYGLPYDTSLTNPLKQVGGSQARTSIGQAEPNGVFASTNTSATWVMCLGSAGSIEPIYVESKVTIYPYPLHVDYSTGRVKKAGQSSVSINNDMKRN